MNRNLVGGVARPKQQISETKLHLHSLSQSTLVKCIHSTRTFIVYFTHCHSHAIGGKREREGGQGVQRHSFWLLLLISSLIHDLIKLTPQSIFLCSIPFLSTHTHTHSYIHSPPYYPHTHTYTYISILLKTYIIINYPFAATISTNQPTNHSPSGYKSPFISTCYNQINIR